MSTWLLQIGGAPVNEDQGFDAAPAESTWVLNDSWQYLTTFAAAPAEGLWTTDWALHDSPLPLVGWAVVPPPAGGLALRMLMGVGT